MPRLDSLTFEERVALVRAVVDVVTIDAENNVQIDIAIYTERLLGKDDAVTNPTPALIPVVRSQRRSQIRKLGAVV